jgi:hypothetical protein
MIFVQDPKEVESWIDEKAQSFLLPWTHMIVKAVGSYLQFDFFGVHQAEQHVGVVVTYIDCKLWRSEK